MSPERALLEENERLRKQLQEAEELLDAIRNGRVDALVVSKPGQENIYTLQGADHTYRILIETMDEGAAILSRDATILYSNRSFAQILQMPLHQLTGSTMSDHIADQDRKHFNALHHDVFAGNAIRTEIHLLSAHNNQIPSLMSLRAFAMEGLEMACMVVTDLTEQKKTDASLTEKEALLEEIHQRVAERTEIAEERARVIAELKQTQSALRESNRELNEYTYAVVHNVKAPFRAVQNYANFLLEDLGGDLKGEPKQFLEGIQNAVHQANQQFLDLDALYKIRKYEPEFETVDVRAMLDEIAALHRAAPDREVIFPEWWPVAKSEQFLLRQILAELIQNGLKYNRSEIKKVEVDWEREDNRFDINVRDNGIGIDPQFHEHVFHIFKRLHTEEEYEGTGIGLAIVRRAVKKIGGTMRLQSAVGEGSTFVISLPAAMVEGGRRA